MIQTFLICLVLAVANNCGTIHPDLNALIPDYDKDPNIKNINLNLLDQCASMFFGDNWTGGFNTTLAKLCNDNEDWQKVISRY